MKQTASSLPFFFYYYYYFFFPHLITLSYPTGKSTLACSLGRELHSRGKLSYVLDGDNLRHGLNKNLGFSPEDRTENIRRVGKYVLKKRNSIGADSAPFRQLKICFVHYS